MQSRAVTTMQSAASNGSSRFDFLKLRIATSNSRDMRNLMSVAFGFLNRILGTEKRSANIFGKAVGAKVFVKVFVK